MKLREALRHAVRTAAARRDLSRLDVGFEFGLWRGEQQLVGQLDGLRLDLVNAGVGGGGYVIEANPPREGMTRHTMRRHQAVWRGGCCEGLPPTTGSVCAPGHPNPPDAQSVAADARVAPVKNTRAAGSRVQVVRGVGDCEGLGSAGSEVLQRDRAHRYARPALRRRRVGRSSWRLARGARAAPPSV